MDVCDARVICTGVLQLGRYYRLPFVPIGLLGRLISRFLHIPDARHRVAWANGLVFDWHDQSALVELWPPESELRYERSWLRESPASITCFASSSASLRLFSLPERLFFSRARRVLVRMGANAFIVPSSASGAGVAATVSSTQRLLSRCIETVDVLLSAFPNLGVVEKRIPCSHCFAQRDALLEPFLFALADCLHAVESAAAFVYDCWLFFSGLIMIIIVDCK